MHRARKLRELLISVCRIDPARRRHRMGPDHGKRLTIDCVLSDDRRNAGLPEMTELGRLEGKAADERNAEVVVAGMDF